MRTSRKRAILRLLALEVGVAAASGSSSSADIASFGSEVSVEDPISLMRAIFPGLREVRLSSSAAPKGSSAPALLALARKVFQALPQVLTVTVDSVVHLRSSATSGAAGTTRCRRGRSCRSAGRSSLPSAPCWSL